VGWSQCREESVAPSPVAQIESIATVKELTVPAHKPYHNDRPTRTTGWSLANGSTANGAANISGQLTANLL